MANVRRRKDVLPRVGEEDEYSSSSKKHSSRSSSSSSLNESSLSTPLHYLSIVLCIVAALAITYHLTGRVPPPRKASDTPLNEFAEERAMNFLSPLLKQTGYRVAGTAANEVFTAQYILDHLNAIKENSACKATSSCPDMEIDVQHVEGSSNIKFLEHYIAAKFSNITNIAVKLTPKNPKAAEKGTILLNSHFDSALGALGATDAGALCAIMIEIIRALRDSKEKQFELNYPVIFLFNGAEEPLLMAAHGFATKHPWVKDIKLVLNMDSTGTGPATLFQLTSDRAVRAYAHGAPRPHGSSVALDLFKTGKFPGDTDFRIFRDYAAIPGADFAYYRNGYMYHTLIDDEEHLLPGSLQHLGDNILGTLKELNTQKMLDVPETNDVAVFFDVFGKIMFVFDYSTVAVLNTVAIVFALGTISYNPVAKKLEPLRMLAKAAIPFLSVVVGVVLAVVLALASAFLLRNTFPMRWFSNQYLILPLFSVPTIIGLLISDRVLHSYLFRQYLGSTQPKPLALVNIKRQVASGTLLFFTVILVVVFFRGVSFSLWVSTVFFSLAIIAESMVDMPRSAANLAFMGYVLFPMALWVDFSVCVLQLLIPVMARASAEAPVDIVIGVLTCIPTIFFFLHVLPLFHSHPKHKSIIKLLAVVYIIAVAFAAVSPIYTRDTPKRIFFQHQKRTTSNKEHSYHLLFSKLDPINEYPLLANMRSHFDQVGKEHAFYLDQPQEQIFNGTMADWGMLYPLDRFFTHGLKFAATPSVLVNTGKDVAFPTLEVIEDSFSEENNVRTLRLNMTYVGMEWSTLAFQGRPVKWDIEDEIPSEKMETYHIRHVGGYGVSSWQVNLSFLGKDPINFAVTGLHFGHTHLSKDIVEHLPDWVAPASLITSVAEYIV